MTSSEKIYYFYCYWQASRVSETLSGVYNFEKSYIYRHIYSTGGCHTGCTSKTISFT